MRAQSDQSTSMARVVEVSVEKNIVFATEPGSQNRVITLLTTTVDVPEGTAVRVYNTSSDDA
ncbi:MAG: hypothetical protein JNM34_05430 [Chthonomonadaceae bacterium]|nr:hypothetical protein [Chthonomonadaceae bacterium]